MADEVEKIEEDIQVFGREADILSESIDDIMDQTSEKIRDKTEKRKMSLQNWKESSENFRVERTSLENCTSILMNMIEPLRFNEDDELELKTDQWEIFLKIRKVKEPHDIQRLKFESARSRYVNILDETVENFATIEIMYEIEVM